jgi:cyclase
MVSIPVVACGGAGNLEHLKNGYFEGNAHALAAGSIFVYHGPRRAVLINYPSKSELKQLFN